MTGARSDAIVATAIGGQKTALSLRDLHKAYQDVVAVDGLELEIIRGECFGLLGPNGAGKTTTIEICEGLTEADSGDVQVLGMNWTSDANELRQRLGIQLRADFTLVEDYKYRTPAKLACPITVFGGLDDSRITTAQLEAWSIETSDRCTRHLVPGGHFFIDSARAELLALVRQELGG